MSHDLKPAFETGVAVGLEPEGRKTRLTLTQSGFAASELRDDCSSGWESILEGLARVVGARRAG